MRIGSGRWCVCGAMHNVCVGVRVRAWNGLPVGGVLSSEVACAPGGGGGCERKCLPGDWAVVYRGRIGTGSDVVHTFSRDAPLPPHSTCMCFLGVMIGAQSEPRPRQASASLWPLLALLSVTTRYGVRSSAPGQAHTLPALLPRAKRAHCLPQSEPDLASLCSPHMLVSVLGSASTCCRMFGSDTPPLHRTRDDYGTQPSSGMSEIDFSRLQKRRSSRQDPKISTLPRLLKL